MCRSCSDGGRRCPADQNINKRRAQQRARYRRRIEAAGGAVRSGFGRPLAPAVVDTEPASLTDRIAALRERLARTDPAALTTTDRHGFSVATAEGAELDEALQAVGAELDDRIAEQWAAIYRPLMQAELALSGETARSREELKEQFAELEAEELRLSMAMDAAIDAGGEGLYEAMTGFEAVAGQLDTLSARLTRWDAVEARYRAQAALETLGEIREFGLPSDVSVSEIIDVERSDARAADAVAEAMETFPSDWLDSEVGYLQAIPVRPVGDPTAPRRLQSLGRRVPLRVKTTRGRASYSHATQRRDGELRAEITVSGKTDRERLRAATHEFGHRMERVMPMVNAVAQVHLARRTMAEGGEERSPLRSMAGDRSKAPETLARMSWNRGEWTREGNFASPYIARQYPGDVFGADQTSEAISCSMEAIFAGSYGGFQGRRGYRVDSAMRRMMLGLLATA